MTRQDGAAIEVRGLTKSYGDVHAVQGIDLLVARGQIFALLGPNGAGKTTTVEILEGYRSRDGGTVQVLGYDPARQRRALKSRIGIVLQSSGMDRYLTAAETVAMYAGYYPRPRPVDEVIGLVGLQAKRNTRVLQLSGGQQRRLDVAIALVGNPDLLFLDEPTTGFDPSARHEAWEVIKNLATLGKTVLLTTHYLEEAADCDEVAFLNSGRIVRRGNPRMLVEQLGRYVIEVETDQPAELARSLEPRLGPALIEADRLHFLCNAEPAELAALRDLHARSNTA